MNIMFVVNLFCYIFTAYFLAAVAHETYNDLKEGEYADWKVYAKKFARKFWSNFIYKLP